MTEQEANKTIAEFMDLVKIPMFAASNDNGLSARFTNESRAVVQHFLDDDPNGYHKDFKVFDWSYDKLFTNSLDSLVPVWEKLGAYPEFDYNYDSNFINKWCCDLFVKDDFIKIVGIWAPSPQEAAAIATAKAIQELK